MGFCSFKYSFGPYLEKRRWSRSILAEGTWSVRCFWEFCYQDQVWISSESSVISLIPFLQLMRYEIQYRIYRIPTRERHTLPCAASQKLCRSNERVKTSISKWASESSWVDSEEFTMNISYCMGSSLPFVDNKFKCGLFELSLDRTYVTLIWSYLHCVGHFYGATIAEWEIKVSWFLVCWKMVSI